MNKSAVILKAAVLLVLTSTLCGCSHVVDTTIADTIKSQLPKAIGPAQSYNVSVGANPMQVVGGRIGEVDITGIGVNLSPEILLDHIQIQAHDIDVDSGSRKIKSVGNVLFEAQIGQDSIEHYLTSQSSNPAESDEHLSVELNDSSVTASMRVKSFGLWVPVSVTGTFEVDPDNDKHILFEPSRGSLSIIPLPIFVMKLAMERINPVIDLSNSTVPVDLSSVSINSGVLEIAGSADLNQSIAEQR